MNALVILLTPLFILLCVEGISYWVNQRQSFVLNYDPYKTPKMYVGDIPFNFKTRVMNPYLNMPMVLTFESEPVDKDKFTQIINANLKYVCISNHAIYNKEWFDITIKNDAFRIDGKVDGDKCIITIKGLNKPVYRRYKRTKEKEEKREFYKYDLKKKQP